MSSVVAVFFRVGIMKARLERLIEEKQILETQLVQIQSMLRSIDYYVSEELLIEAESNDEPSEER